MSHQFPAVLRPPGTGSPIEVTRFPVGPGLDQSVRYLWSVQWDLPAGVVHEQEVLSYPAVHLAVEDGSVEVHGVVTSRFVRRLRGRGRVLGVHFRPGGLSALSRVRVADLVDRTAPATELLGTWAENLAATSSARSTAEAAALAAGVLAANIGPPSPSGRFVDDAVEAVVSDKTLTNVSELAALLHTTVRTVQRRFERHLGVGPKWVLRRQRIYDALERLSSDEPVDWAKLAAELGFADQAHLSHVFRQLVGVSPRAYERRLSATRHGG